MTLEEKVNGNGHLDDDESQEDIEGAWIDLSQLNRGADFLSFAKQNQGLMQKIYQPGSERYKDEELWRTFNFEDPKEARKHVDAYYEAVDLGMDTSYNISYAHSLVATNRRTGDNNIIARLLGTLHNNNMPNYNVKRKESGGTNPRSPLS